MVCSARGSAIVLLCATLCGCGSLLPRGRTDTPTGFESFEQAQAAVERIVALETPTSELGQLGFDPVAGHNVTLIPYPEIAARLAPLPGVPVDQLEPGIRQCIEAQSRCRGYLFHFERQERRREGGFWADFLNLRRTTYVSGWWFDALIIVSDGKVMFRNFGGQSRTDRVDRQVNPLGLFQSLGESAGSSIVH